MPEPPRRAAGSHPPVALRMRVALVLLAFAATVVPALAATSAAARRTLAVSYVSSGAIYVDGGRLDGLAVGSRLEVRRRGEAIALLEVAYVADRSAATRVVSERQAVAQGDEVVILVPADEAAPAPEPVPVPEPVPEPEPEPVTVRPPLSVPPLAGPISRPPARLKPRASGSVSLRQQQFSDDVSGRGFDESTARLSLRLRNIQGLPLDLRIRGRGREVGRTGGSRSSTASTRSDRLYELSLTYQPDDGRFAWALGRLGASPFVSIGYLDGALGQLRLSRRVYVGLFGGSRPAVAELGLESAGTKYGGFLRYSTGNDAGPTYAEVVLAGIGEYARGGEVSREYVSLESRFGSGNRWSLFQRAELDLNRGWRQELAGASSELTNASLTASFRLTPSWRAQLSYDQRRNYFTYETRPLPEEVFTRFLREGVRASLEWQSRAGWNATVGVGREGDDSGGEDTTSSWLSVYHSNLLHWNLLAGIDLSTYSGGVAEGYVGSLRLRRYFTKGHDVGLTLGMSEASLAGSAVTRHNEWARLSTTLQLPYRLYLVGEVEATTGDDLEGLRYSLEAGYQF